MRRNFSSPRRMSHRGGSGSQRRKVWARQTGVLTLPVGTPGPTVQEDLLANFNTALGSSEPGMTVARVVGNFTATFQSGETANAGGLAFIGLIQDESNRALNGPDSFPYQDWFYYNMTYIQVPPAPADASEGAGFHRWDVDLRAKRRLDEISESLWISAQNNTNPFVNGSELVVYYQLNLLMLLP